MSSRIRLARNLADFPFISRANRPTAPRSSGMLRDRIMQIAGPRAS